MKKILIVEDDLDDQFNFKEAINALGEEMQYQIANNGHEAFECLEKNPSFDLIFLDLNMPLLDGFETLRTLKQTKKYCDIPVYILSTSNNKGDISLCNSLGAKEFVTKPSSFNEFRDWLKKVLMPVSV